MFRFLTRQKKYQKVSIRFHIYQFGNFLYLCIVMRVFAKKILWEFWEVQNDAEEPLKTWFKEATKASWNNPMDIKANYVKASILKNNRVVFNICGNRYRLVVEINYKRQWVFIRFIGTHTDYDKINAEKI